jgi:hypothetical protein
MGNISTDLKVFTLREQFDGKMNGGGRKWQHTSSEKYWID